MQFQKLFLPLTILQQSLLFVLSSNNHDIYEKSHMERRTANQWLQIHGDIVGFSSGDKAGWSVAMSSNGLRIAIGAPHNDANGSQSGNVFIFEEVGNSWVQVNNDIRGEASGDQSGHSIAMSGDGLRVAIAAPRNDVNGFDSGHVRILEDNGSAWVQVHDDINGDASNDRSGNAIAISQDGMRLIISANSHDGNGTNSGQVRIFEDNGVSWVKVHNDIYGEMAQDMAADSVAISADGSRIAFGVVFALGGSNGYVRVFEDNGSAWVLVHSNIFGESSEDESGWSVAMSANGTRVAIGGLYGDDFSGHVRIFEDIGSEWRQVHSTILGEAQEDQSGYSVAMSASGHRVAIGAIMNSDNAIWSGQVRIFEDLDSAWIQVNDDIDGQGSNDWFGYSVDMSADGSRVVVGAPYSDSFGSDRGKILIYEDMDDENVSIRTPTFAPTQSSPTNSPTNSPSLTMVPTSTSKPSFTPTSAQTTTFAPALDICAGCGFPPLIVIFNIVLDALYAFLSELLQLLNDF